MMSAKDVVQIEVTGDLTATSRCDEGFLHVRRFLCRNHRADGSTSKVYQVDVVDRPRLDAVAVIVFRRTDAGIEVLTRQQLRPAAYFRKGKQPVLPDGREYLFVEEIVAGLLELTDVGVEGLRHRAVEEVREEAGFEVSQDDIVILGAPFFVAPGILSEKIHLTAVDVTGRAQFEPLGDGSPLEEGAKLRFWPLKELLQACGEGVIQDAKTEIAAVRLLAYLADSE